MPGFELRKWYLDCATDSGELVIVYQAELRWRRLRLGYASVLVHAQGETRTSTTLRPGRGPVLEGAQVRWACAPLGLEGRWDSQSPAVRELLLDSPEGRVDWRVHAPRARVTLTLGGRSFTGPGYAEELRMTARPWRLPIDELRWGRFCAATAGLVWVEWRGAEPRCGVWLDGVRCPGAEVLDEGVRAEGLALSFGAREVLREGRIGDTVLRHVPALRSAPGRVLGLHETKWRMPATLVREGLAPIPGAAVHEVVRWP
jgi:hypothetical protein